MRLIHTTTGLAHEALAEEEALSDATADSRLIRPADVI